MTAVQLKALCKERGLKVSGKKAELQDRLREHFLTTSTLQPGEDEFDTMSDTELQQSLAARTLGTNGDRADLLERLRLDLQFTQDLQNAVPPDEAHGYRTIGEALEAVAKNGGAMEEILAQLKAKSDQKPKTVDVTIKSLGMKPDKQTAGGAASVTADVLRSLAGDPFENPPRYGSVSNPPTLLTMMQLKVNTQTPFSLHLTRPTNSLEVEKKGTKHVWHYSAYVPLAQLIQ